MRLYGGHPERHHSYKTINWSSQSVCHRWTIRQMRTRFSPIRLAGSWGYLTGNWGEATPYFFFTILIHVRKNMNNNIKNMSVSFNKNDRCQNYTYKLEIIHQKVE